MKIELNNFRKYRLKKFISFLVCMILSIGIAFVIEAITRNEIIYGISIFIGLIMYDYTVGLPFIEKNYIAEIENKNDSIYITSNKKVYNISKARIKKVEMREIMGTEGRNLQTIGYRLSVYTDDNKKYSFDSTLKRNDNDKSTDIIKLYHMLESYVRKV